ncbi:hypothetical protein [Marininema halotolerans]|uniref:hypothetical protein n=1 Tax=Marininema halotolerans TaxID=1155944 RepID=UPI00159528FE|nr:hypothetical protein [Marininema halotolerans]
MSPVSESGSVSVEKATQEQVLGRVLEQGLGQAMDQVQIGGVGVDTFAEVKKGVDEDDKEALDLVWVLGQNTKELLPANELETAAFERVENTWGIAWETRVRMFVLGVLAPESACVLPTDSSQGEATQEHRSRGMNQGTHLCRRLSPPRPWEGASLL